MMAHQNKQFDRDPHQAVWELLPWYVNDTLEGPERSRVAHHISECQRCEEEVGRCRTIAGVIRNREAPEWTPSPERLGRMMARIDRQSGVSQRESRWIDIREWIEKIRLSFEATPSSLRWALAGQTALIVLLAAAIVLQLSAAPSLIYQTLSDPGAGPDPRRMHIQVVFADDMTEREIRRLLTSVGAAIVAGPSPTAAYTLAIAGDAPDGAARIQKTLEVLRAHPEVRLAEPKDR
jgi:hypothetical protein